MPPRSRTARARRRPPAAPATLGVDAWLLGMDMIGVMALRTARIARGGAAGRAEAERMIVEKAQAAFDLGVELANGRLGTAPEEIARRTVAHLGKSVRANYKRLLADPRRTPRGRR